MKSFDIVDRSKAPTTTKYTPRKVTIDAHVLADAAVTLEGLDAELASLAREVPRARFWGCPIALGVETPGHDIDGRKTGWIKDWSDEASGLMVTFPDEFYKFGPAVSYHDNCALQ